MAISSGESRSASRLKEVVVAAFDASREPALAEASWPIVLKTGGVKELRVSIWAWAICGAMRPWLFQTIMSEV